MASAKRKLATGKTHGRKALLRDDMIREDNDGSRIQEAQVVRTVKNNKKELFRGQSKFIAEYRRRAALVG